MTTDPMLEVLYKRTQEAERQRVIDQAKFEKEIASGVRDVNGVPTGKVAEDTDGN